MTVTYDTVVVDTNVLISALIFRQSVPRRAVEFAFLHADVLSSAGTRNELREVSGRAKFERYLPRSLRIAAVESILEEMLPVAVSTGPAISRDAKDDKFLYLALAGGAKCIVSGDMHSLELSPFRGSPVLRPRDYLLAEGVTA